ncbi:hypothetical protein SAMN05660462_00900 [Proteiniborus ethanoligenes]|uniref:Uncharacterized protein n=1 Tax=Proteiniborus ethanoligenes TaxID=415015 RepID=A0A1H3MPG2_9FIRM|nr:hypothetical protein [Proteiniborus ethanoligenes]SDY78400.1 hypothetical protein SAMN05660462_00900 [Proteiniborus ethanoligenes]
MRSKVKFILLGISILCFGYFAYAYNQISGFKLLFMDSQKGAFYLKTYKIFLIVGIVLTIATVYYFVKDNRTSKNFKTLLKLLFK